MFFAEALALIIAFENYFDQFLQLVKFYSFCKTGFKLIWFLFYIFTLSTINHNYKFLQYFVIRVENIIVVHTGKKKPVWYLLLYVLSHGRMNLTCNLKLFTHFWICSLTWLIIHVIHSPIKTSLRGMQPHIICYPFPCLNVRNKGLGSRAIFCFLRHFDASYYGKYWISFRVYLLLHSSFFSVFNK